jgi:hypothetical protein
MSVSARKTRAMPVRVHRTAGDSPVARVIAFGAETACGTARVAMAQAAARRRAAD